MSFTSVDIFSFWVRIVDVSGYCLGFFRMLHDFRSTPRYSPKTDYNQHKCNINLNKSTSILLILIEINPCVVRKSAVFIITRYVTHAIIDYYQMF